MPINGRTDWPQSVDKLKNRVRELTRWTRGTSFAAVIRAAPLAGALTP